MKGEPSFETTGNNIKWRAQDYFSNFFEIILKFLASHAIKISAGGRTLKILGDSKASVSFFQFKFSTSLLHFCPM
jgi:hypothetical protein